LVSGAYPAAALSFVRNFGPIVIDTWGISALPGRRLIGEIQANKPLAKLEIISGNTGGVSVSGTSIVAEPQLSGTRRITVKAYDERGQTATRSIVLTWQSGRLWTPVELAGALVDWYSLDFHGTVSRHINAIKSLTPISTTRSATPTSASLRPTFGITAAGVPRASFDGGDAASHPLPVRIENVDTAKQSAQVNRRVLITDPEAAFSMQARQTEALANMMSADSSRIDTLFQDVGAMRGTVEVVDSKVDAVAAGVNKLTDAMAVLVKHEVTMEHNAAEVRAMREAQEKLTDRVQKIELKVPGWDELRVWVIRAGLGVLGVVGMAVVALVVKTGGAG
jgi:hypothetical protein